MLDKNDILFPKTVSDKHPFTQDVLKLAEQADIGVGQIAEILKCSQPYISQLKKGSQKVQLEKLEPLIHLLSPKLPGDNFQTLSVFKRALPVIPEDWEQQVLLRGLSNVSKQSPGGQYPIGDDGFAVVVDNHNYAVDYLNDNGNPYNRFNSPSTINKQVLDAESELLEALAAYQAETGEYEKLIAEDDSKLREDLKNAFIHLDIERYSQSGQKIEEVVDKHLSRIFGQQRPEPRVIKRRLVEACRRAAECLKIPAIVHAFSESETWELDDNDLPSAVEAHATRILQQLQEYIKQITDAREKKRNKFRLDSRYKKAAFKTWQTSVLNDPRMVPDWQQLGEDLFSNSVCEVYRSANEQPYKVEMGQAFVDWAQTLAFKTEKELVQICGKQVVTKEFSGCLITVFELPSEKFVYLLTFHSELLKENVTLLSDALQPRALLEVIEAEAVSLQGQEQADLLLQELRSWLLQAGYRVSDVRAIY
uniref:hypothetical protein n=1 Tax=Rheinheimera sp. TaxID=1869214 RepID=UPI004047FE41